MELTVLRSWVVSSFMLDNNLPLLLSSGCVITCLWSQRLAMEDIWDYYVKHLVVSYLNIISLSRRLRVLIDMFSDFRELQAHWRFGEF